jgi:hypothetical protein
MEDFGEGELDVDAFFLPGGILDPEMETDSYGLDYQEPHSLSHPSVPVASNPWGSDGFVYSDERHQHSESGLSPCGESQTPRGGNTHAARFLDSSSIHVTADIQTGLSRSFSSDKCSMNESLDTPGFLATQPKMAHLTTIKADVWNREITKALVDFCDDNACLLRESGTRSALSIDPLPQVSSTEKTDNLGSKSLSVSRPSDFLSWLPSTSQNADNDSSVSWSGGEGLLVRTAEQGSEVKERIPPTYVDEKEGASKGRSLSKEKIRVAYMPISNATVNSVKPEQTAFDGQENEPKCCSGHYDEHNLGSPSARICVSEENWFVTLKNTKVLKKSKEAKREKQCRREKSAHDEKGRRQTAYCRGRSTGRREAQALLQWWNLYALEPLSHLLRLATEVYEVFDPLLRRLVESTGFVLGFSLKLVFVLVSGTSNVLKYAANEMRRAGSSLPCYLVLYALPNACDLLMTNLSLPHVSPHVISNLTLYCLCMPCGDCKHKGGESSSSFPSNHVSDDLCQLVLRTVRVCLPLAFVAEGFTKPNSSVMMLDESTRMILAYVLSMLRSGLILSPVCWAGWSIQVLISSSLREGVLLNLLLFSLGLALVRLTTVIQAESRTLHRAQS